jgi:hypothetical protein
MIQSTHDTNPALPLSHASNADPPFHRTIPVGSWNQKRLLCFHLVHGCSSLVLAPGGLAGESTSLHSKKKSSLRFSCLVTRSGSCFVEPSSLALARSLQELTFVDVVVARAVPNKHLPTLVVWVICLNLDSIIAHNVPSLAEVAMTDRQPVSTLSFPKMPPNFLDYLLLRALCQGGPMPADDRAPLVSSLLCWFFCRVRV